MRTIRLGKTNLQVTKTAFGALPIQRIDFADSDRLLRKAFAGGINFFDTARGYSDSEAKIGHALSDVRDQIIIATKTPSRNRTAVLADIDTSLKMLQTDYIDVLQLHNPAQVPDLDDPEGAYAGLIEAKRQGKIRHFGISNHRLETAVEAVKSGLFATLQFPLSYLSSDQELALADICREYDVGLIAMKALSGGLITNARAAFAFIGQYPEVVPIWGIQHQYELDEFISLEQNPPLLDAALQAVIASDQAELQGAFCRGCGYCLPCPQEIAIPMAARMSLLMRRAPTGPFLEAEWQQKMQQIETCTECGQCRSRCPYELDIPELLKKELKAYRAALS